MVGGDPEWARALRRQLAMEIELVSQGLGNEASLLNDDAVNAAGNRIAELRRRLKQVERLIDAIEAAAAQSNDNIANAEQANAANTSRNDGSALNSASRRGSMAD